MEFASECLGEDRLSSHQIEEIKHRKYTELLEENAEEIEKLRSEK